VRRHRCLRPLALLATLLVTAGAGRAQDDSPGPAAGDPVAEVKALLAEGRVADAEARAREHLSALGGPDAQPSPALADALDALGLVLLKTARADDECRTLLERAVEVRTDTAGRESPGFAQATWRLGDWHLANRDFAAARESYELALEIQVRTGGEDSPGASEVRKRLAQAYGALGLDREALALVARESGIVEREHGDRHPDLCPLLYQYALALDRTGEPRAAEAAFLRALSIADESLGPDHVLVAFLSNGLGMLYSQSLHEYTNARPQFERAIVIAEAAGHPAVASFRNNLGVLLKDLGDWEEAQRVYEQALGELIAQQGEDDPYVASTMANVAYVAMLAGDLDRARELEATALAIRERHLGADHPDVATSLRSQGEIALRSGDFAGARTAFERGLAIRRERLGPAHVETAEIEVDLARALELAGDDASAHALYEQALATLVAKLGPHDPRAAIAQAGLARMTPDPVAARGLALAAEERSRQHARVMVSGLPERQALRFAATRTASLDLALSLPGLVGDDGAIAATWDSLIRSRALVLDEILLRRASARADGGDPVPADVSEYAREYAELLLVVPAAGEEDDHSERLGAARRRHEEAEQRWIDGAENATRVRDVGLAEVRAALPEGSALLAFARFDRGRTAAVATATEAEYLAYVVAAGGEPVVVALGAARDLEPAIRRWRAAVADPSGDPGGAGHEVRGHLWDPIVPHLGNAQLVFIVPDGEIHRVNLAALPDDAGFLVEAGRTLHCLTAERDLTRRHPGDAGRGLLAIGGASFSLAATPAGHAPLFAPLPATDAETAAIASLWADRGDGEVLRLSGENASEEAFKRHAQGHRVIHLATHAFFSGVGGEPATTRGIGGVGGAAVPAARPLPADVAGIALAGANDPWDAERTDDGILTAGEIAALDLRSTEWAVLSACDTGVGSLQDLEGVLGLRRAFEAAGARTIVMSLWAVDDEATREWMESLYRARLELGLGTAESVRRAARATLESRRSRGLSDHPFYWGGFVAAGNWN